MSTEQEEQSSEQSAMIVNMILAALIASYGGDDLVFNISGRKKSTGELVLFASTATMDDVGRLCPEMSIGATPDGKWRIINGMRVS